MTLLVAASALVAILTVLLLAPVRVRVDVAAGDGHPRADWHVRWLLFAWSGGTGRRTPRPAAPPQPRRPRRAARARPPFRWRAALATPGAVRRVVRLVGELLRALRPRDLDATIRIGFADPAATGSMMGAVASVSPRLPVGWRVRIEPEFTGAALEGRARAAWSVAPGHVLWPVATFLGAPVVWRAAWAARRRPRIGLPATG